MRYLLDLLDRKILFELDKDARQPLTALAKKVRESRNVVDYRIRRLQDHGIIKRFVTLMDAGRLGLMVWNVYIEFENVTPQIEKEIISYLVAHRRVWWVSLTSGRWNLVYSICVKGIKEFHTIVAEFNARFGNYILNQSLAAHVEAEVFSRGYFLKKPSEGVLWYKRTTTFQLDETDKAILRDLATDARIPSSQLAQRLKLSPRIVAYRIKNLLHAGIITRFRLHLDVGKIGYGFYKVIVHLKNTSPENDASLREYCRRLGFIFHYMQKIGPWMLELEMDCESFESANRLMKTMKERFPDYLRSYEIMLVYEEPKGELDLGRQI